jgi:hypothetical protein
MKQLLLVFLIALSLKAVSQNKTSHSSNFLFAVGHSTATYKIIPANPRLYMQVVMSLSNDTAYFLMNDKVIGKMPNDSTLITKDSATILFMLAKGSYYAVHNMNIGSAYKK